MGWRVEAAQEAFRRRAREAMDADGASPEYCGPRLPHDVVEILLAAHAREASLLRFHAARFDASAGDDHRALGCEHGANALRIEAALRRSGAMLPAKMVDVASAAPMLRVDVRRAATLTTRPYGQLNGAARAS